MQPSDYGSLDVILRFDACMTRKCADVSIANDTVDEINEFFTYNLTRTLNLDPRIVLAPVHGRVEIVAENGE